MKDQNNITNDESKSVKWNRAVDLFVESVYKPDTSLRGCARNQLCYDELMEVREHVLKYLNSIRSGE